MPKILKPISKITARVFLYLFIASSLICVISLRHNNQTMVKLRDAVYVADKDNKDVNQALNNLRSYVYSHMNTNLSSSSNPIKPPIQLKFTYQRLYETQLGQTQTANQQIYSDAQTHCLTLNAGVYGTSSLACVQNYVINHGVKDAQINIPAGLYQYDFISPSWSSDLAGWSLIASILFLAAFLIKVVINKFRR